MKPEKKMFPSPYSQKYLKRLLESNLEIFSSDFGCSTINCVHTGIEVEFTSNHCESIYLMWTLQEHGPLFEDNNSGNVWINSSERMRAVLSAGREDTECQNNFSS